MTTEVHENSGRTYQEGKVMRVRKSWSVRIGPLLSLLLVALIPSIIINAEMNHRQGKLVQEVNTLKQEIRDLKWSQDQLSKTLMDTLAQQREEVPATELGSLEDQPVEPISRGSVKRPAAVLMARVTAYAPLDNESGICAWGDPTVTATMTKVRRGVVAVDPEKIPYGTRLYIPGYGEVIAEDTGVGLKKYDGYAIDVLVDTYEEAMEWGKQYIDVEVLEWGPGN